MGIAYCGNTIRADFWYDVTRLQPRRLEYLKLLRDLNLTVAVDNVSSGHFHNRPDGSMPPEKKEAIAEFFAKYGDYVQWYEIANEPCMFGGGMAETLNVARWVNQVKPRHVQTTAPGWAYGGGRGTPTNWDADAANRRRVEALCQATNGHSYGFSYADDRGGSFLENLRTFGGVEDGWPKPSLTTETGTNDWHSSRTARGSPRRSLTPRPSTASCGLTSPWSSGRCSMRRSSTISAFLRAPSMRSIRLRCGSFPA